MIKCRGKPRHVLMSHSQVLDCAYNHIRTLLPDIRTLRHMRYLDISRNDLTSLPTEIFQLPRLEVLQVIYMYISLCHLCVHTYMYIDTDIGIDIYIYIDV